MVIKISLQNQRIEQILRVIEIKFQKICDIIYCILQNKTKNDIIVKFYKVMERSVIFYAYKRLGPFQNDTK